LERRHERFQGLSFASIAHTGGAFGHGDGEMQTFDNLSGLKVLLQAVQQRCDLVHVVGV
jgi:hypothetical protein